MIFLLSLGLTWSYLVTPILGFVATLASILAVLIFDKSSPIYKLFILLIVTMPLYMVPVLPGLPILFSWTTFILIAISLILLKKGEKLGFLPTLSIVFFFLTGTATAFLIDPATGGLYYFLQLSLFILPIICAYRARRFLSNSFNSDFDKYFINTFAQVLTSMGISVLIQWALFTIVGLRLGNISEFKSRVTFDLTISAYSVLSGILCLGIIIGPTLWRLGFRKLAIILPVISALAILINTSRTGLFAAGATLVLLILFPPKGMARVKIRLLAIPLGVVFLIVFTLLASSGRFSNLSEVFDDNGRFDAFTHAFSIFGQSFSNFLVGLGYTYDFGISPHNFIAETIVKSGLIMTIFLISWITFLLYNSRNSDWVFLLVALLVGSMLYAGFYAVKVFTIVAMLSIISWSLQKVEPESPLPKLENAPQK